MQQDALHNIGGIWDDSWFCGGLALSYNYLQMVLHISVSSHILYLLAIPKFDDIKVKGMGALPLWIFNA